MENDANYKAAETQYKLTKRQLAKPSEMLSAQGELPLSDRAFVACLARLAGRVKILETDIHNIKTKNQAE